MWSVVAINGRTGIEAVLHTDLTEREADTVVSKHYPLSESKRYWQMRYVARPTKW